jgi:tripartite-type tricarboxylate transporter receptor subunit TctC
MKMKSITIMTTALVAAGFGASVFSATASADAVSDFYAKTRVKVVIGYSPGGGYDRGGRVVARHINKYIPGKPRVIAQNMPGAGSMRSLNWLYNKGPKDGSAMAHFHPAAAREAYIGAAGVQFDPRKFYWLGSFSRGSSLIFVRSDSGVKTLKEAMQKQVVLGATSPRSGGGVYPRILNQVLGTKFKVVVGYGSTGESTLAMERGEVQGLGAWAWTQLRNIQPNWIKDKFVTILAIHSVARRPDLPNVPSVIEFAKTDEDRKVLEAILKWEDLARPFVMAPGTVPARAAAMRKAFATMVGKADFKKDIGKASLEVDPVLGADAEVALAKLYAYPKAVADRARIVYSEMRAIKVAKAKKKTAKGLTIAGIKGKGRKMRLTFTDGAGKTWKFKAREKNLGRKTKINGKKAKANKLKKGMVCSVSYYGKGGLIYSASCKG